MLRVFIVTDDSPLPDLTGEQLAEEVAIVGAAGAVEAAETVFQADVILWQAERPPDDFRPLLSILLRHAPVLLIGPPAVMAEGLQAGAPGVVSDDAEPGRLLAALRAVAAGLRVIDPDAEARAEGADGVWRPEDLTGREREVLQLLAEGLANKQIARRLGISEHTVKFHVAAILGKVGAHTRTEAVTRAARAGLITL